MWLPYSNNTSAEVAVQQMEEHMEAGDEETMNYACCDCGKSLTAAALMQEACLVHTYNGDEYMCNHCKTAMEDDYI